MSGPGKVVRVVAVWHAAECAADEVRAIARDLAARSRREPGCLGFDVLESAGQPGRFVLLEEYAGEEGRRLHAESAHFHELVLGLAVPLLAHRQVDTYDLIEVDEATGGDVS
jgi:quinol monooxygenase YgiN